MVVTQGLLSGKTKSCGCLNREITSRAKTKHGKCGSETYSTWVGMKTRCNNPKSSNFKYYGGRGITYDPRWESFENFLEDMGERPEGMTLDRIDVNGNYCKDNCRWATKQEQARNSRERKRYMSDVPGVYWREKYGVWVVTIRSEGKQIHIGHFKDYDQAVAAKRLAEISYPW